MPIPRLGKSKQRLQQAVDRSRSKQVPSTHDVGHALKCVIDHHRQMIARRQIAAAEDDVAPNLRRRGALRRDGFLAIFRPAETSRSSVDRAPHVEAERSLVAAGETVACFCRGKRAAGSGIERRAVRVALPSRGSGDLRTAAKAGVDQAPLIEAGERRRVIVAMLALPARRGKAKPEPREVVNNRGLKLRFAARAVQIFNAQQHASVDFGSDAFIHQRGIGVAEMERSVWRRRKAQDGYGREEFIGHGGKANT
jgi:hypothetical protein